MTMYELVPATLCSFMHHRRLIVLVWEYSLGKQGRTTS